MSSLVENFLLLNDLENGFTYFKIIFYFLLALREKERGNIDDDLFVLQVVPTVYTDISGHTIQSNQVWYMHSSFHILLAYYFSY
jgi:hypothetical protein